MVRPEEVLVNRMIRQHELIPEDLQNASVLVVGTGMLGSWTCEALARIAGDVRAYDFDMVGPENVGTQAFCETQIGAPKVVALADRLDGLPYTGYAYRMSPEEQIPYAIDVVVSAVDSMAARRMCAERALSLGADLFVDTRAHGTIGVVCAILGADIEDYLSTLESDENVPEPACGLEGTAFVGLWVAQQVASTLVRHYRGMTSPTKLVYDVAMSDVVLSEQKREVNQQEEQ